MAFDKPQKGRTAKAGKVFTENTTSTGTGDKNVRVWRLSVQPEANAIMMKCRPCRPSRTGIPLLAQRPKSILIQFAYFGKF
jgi:hypothetical protein